MSLKLDQLKQLNQVQLDQTEDQLVASIQTGSDQAFESIYKKYEGRLMGFLHFKLKNSEIAEEVFQITWSKVLDHIQNYKKTNTFSSWLFTIANNSVKDWYKKAHNQNKLLESFKLLNSQDVNEIKHQSLNLSFLEDPFKSVIELQYVQGLTSKEISKELNLSESNVRKISSRAKKQIKKHILNGGWLK